MVAWEWSIENWGRAQDFACKRQELWYTLAVWELNTVPYMVWGTAWGYYSYDRGVQAVYVAGVQWELEINFGDACGFGGAAWFWGGGLRGVEGGHGLAGEESSGASGASRFGHAVMRGEVQLVEVMFGPDIDAECEFGGQAGHVGSDGQGHEGGEA